MNKLLKFVAYSSIFLSTSVFANQYIIGIEGGASTLGLPSQANYDSNELLPNQPVPSYQDYAVHEGDGNTLGWRVYAGYNFDLSSNFSIAPELGYGDSTPFTFEDTRYLYNSYPFEPVDYFYTWSATWHSAYIDLLVSGHYKLGTHFSLLGKLGIATLMQHVIWQVTRVDIPASSTPDLLDHGSSMLTKLAPEAAIGMNYQWSSGIGLSLTYSQIFADSIGDSESDLSNISAKGRKVASISNVLVGLSYSF